jgi:hypothetical protein
MALSGSLLSVIYLWESSTAELRAAAEYLTLWWLW